MTGNVIHLPDAFGKKTYPRRLFQCAECECRTFKIHETDGEVMVECANCEAFIALEDIMGSAEGDT